MSIYLILFLISLPFAPNRNNYTNWWKRFWCRTACIILGIRLKIVKSSVDLPATYLTVGNHISFFDPVVTLAVVKGMPVAKAEIAKYPLIGFAAKKTGIIWVERDKVNSRSMARMAIKKSLEEGRSVLVYPEGTISHGPLDLRDFKKGSFAAAQQAGKEVVFCAISYSNPHAYWKEENSLLKQFLLQFGSLTQSVVIHLSNAQPIDNPETASKKAREWIQNRLRSIADAADLP